MQLRYAESGWQMADGVSMIFFRSGISDVSIEGAERLLAARGLQVARDGAALSVRWGNGPELSVAFSAESHVPEEAAELGGGTPFAAELSQCDSRFELSIDDLDAALDEMNTLIEVQCTLQDATRGYLFNSWNGELSGPEESA